MNSKDFSVPKIMVNMEEVVPSNEEMNEFERKPSASERKCWPFVLDWSRLFVMIYICLISFFSMICYDLPGSLQSQIESIFRVKTYQFEYLYSSYCFPNIILAFFGGILIDKILGVKTSALLISIITLGGQILFTIGGFTKCYWLLLLARFIFGIGGDSIIVALNYYIVLWFSGKGLNFMFGMGMSFSRLGTSFVFLVSPSIYNWLKCISTDPAKHIGITFSIAILSAVLHLSNVIALGWESERKGKLTDVKTRKQEENEDKKDNGGYENKKEVKFRIIDIFVYPFKYWLVAIVFISVQSTILVFVTCSQGLFMSKYKVDSSTADHFGSVFNLILAVTAPLAGILTDRFGKNLLAINLSLLGASLSQIMFIVIPSTPYAPIILFGVSCGVLLSNVFPLTSKVVPATQLGAAYGLMISLGNLSQTVLNILAGYFLQEYGHVATLLFYFALLSAGLLSGLTLYVRVRIDGGTLENFG